MIPGVHGDQQHSTRPQLDRTAYRRYGTNQTLPDTPAGLVFLPQLYGISSLLTH